MGENKKEKFIRVAENRTNQVLHSLKMLGNMSKYNYYEYTPEQIAEIFEAIEKKVQEEKERLMERTKFTLSE